jgi:hypothetical protein
MDRIIGGILVLVLGMAVMAADHEGQDNQPASPERQYKAIWIMTNEYELLRFRPWYEHTARYEMIRIMTGGDRRWGVPSKEEQDIRTTSAFVEARNGFREW